MAKVTRPTKTAEMCVTGLDDSITPKKVATVFACKGMTVLRGTSKWRKSAVISSVWGPARPGSESGSRSGPVEVEEEARRFGDAMSQICDTVMPRAGPRRQVYWWSDEIAPLRSESNAARRQYLRHHRRRQSRDAETEAQLYAVFKENKKTLELAISRAKVKAREELLRTRNEDPWERPYRSQEQALLRGDTCGGGSPATATGGGANRFVSGTTRISASFYDTAEPKTGRGRRHRMRWGSADHFSGVLTGRGQAPGEGYRPRARWCPRPGLGLGSGCPWQGCPAPKGGSPCLSLPSLFRPIVLLDEVGKLFERIIVRRLVQHLTRDGPDLSPNQYGFREDRSTIDAQARVRTLLEEVVFQGGVLLAVSLNIKNAFNTLPFAVIRKALEYHKVPPYLRDIIGAYLEDREIFCVGRNGMAVQRDVQRGVPQGVVLGALLAGTSVFCYVEDTLATARGRASCRLSVVPQRAWH
ncbi:uncharacterized protein LOC128201268 [Galleria mellonella]|uniref:Uncharacterized protein LOC128201268 n=1 Tax=Galleria mellonella TaxID=7137 RepID=A0ABM3MQN9_GALME|nr:uncharacterized protein LOC128201268 [Galleria mellonella]